MIMIYSANPETGALFTDEKKHFYIDTELLQEKALALRTNYLLDRIAKTVGFTGFDELDTYLRCSGVTADVLDSWIMSGTLAENLNLIRR